jgi:hypothetical protein
LKLYLKSELDGNLRVAPIWDRIDPHLINSSILTS